ncbi:MAG: glycosyltransferase, partial [Myxococcota bacterium]
FIARMDADDYSYPERLSQQLELFSRDPELSIVATRVRIVGGGAGYNAYERWQNSLTSHEAITREILVESPLAHPSVMLRHETLHALGGYHDRPWAEDYDLWLRAYAAGFRFAKTDAVLLEWTDHPNRASRQDPRYHERRFIECKSHYLAKTILSERPCVIWGAGRIGPMLGRFLLERGVSVRAFLDVDPRKIGSTRHGRPVLSADTHRHVDGVVLLAAVGARGARELIRREALAMNYGEGHDFFCVA